MNRWLAGVWAASLTGVVLGSGEIAVYGEQASALKSLHSPQVRAHTEDRQVRIPDWYRLRSTPAVTVRSQGRTVDVDTQHVFRVHTDPEEPVAVVPPRALAPLSPLPRPAAADQAPSTVPVAPPLAPVRVADAPVRSAPAPLPAATPLAPPSRAAAVPERTRTPSAPSTVDDSPVPTPGAARVAQVRPGTFRSNLFRLADELGFGTVLVDPRVSNCVWRQLTEYTLSGDDPREVLAYYAATLDFRLAFSSLDGHVEVAYAGPPERLASCYGPAATLAARGGRS